MQTLATRLAALSLAYDLGCEVAIAAAFAAVVEAL